MHILYFAMYEIIAQDWHCSHEKVREKTKFFSMSGKIQEIHKILPQEFYFWVAVRFGNKVSLLAKVIFKDCRLAIESLVFLTLNQRTFFRNF